MKFYEEYDQRMTGYEKKELVMEKVKQLDGYDPDLESFLDNLIDIIILIDKNKIRIKKKFKKFKCF
jgi:hypothetical protein